MATNGRQRSTNWKALIKRGPLTPDELPTKGTRRSYKDRVAGMCVFNPGSRNGGSSLNGTGRTEIVYYLEDYHEPEEILDKWYTVNQDRLEDFSEKAIHYRVSDYGEEFRKISYEKFGPISTSGCGGANKDYSDQKCKKCGEVFTGQFAKHLPKCSGR